MPWNPQQYGLFSSQRRQPFDDLVALVRPVPGARVVDLGCGPGDLTAFLHAHLGAAETLGLDSSATMLAEAVRHVAPGLRFQAADIAAFAPAVPYDVVFSNAALQWLPEPEAIFQRLLSAVAPGGQIAVQVPSNQTSASHWVAREVGAAFVPQPAHIPDVLPTQRYAELLARAGFLDVHVRQQVYVHWLKEPEAVVEWVRGTLLTAWESVLSPDDFGRFLTAYRARLLQVIPDERPFFFPFKRTLMWARRPG